ncbi:MAG: Stp1/IreP family PP2C-type Ser/Thr phosphatase [Alphaproteobacteria bacterium]|uniref:Stp1/IreP family PP2C-type Ser/Thr phosphatase n=1 Tax=Candidatus Nitrobium versatile TaxID=2884831 RepID=A0A953M355_9BACT|nr:Stp1/IreP family PP2C-type Ser/Thr phosphatase [Candidatus Nitrobium versatile]
MSYTKHMKETEDNFRGTEVLHLEAAYRTDRGRRRENNEDSVLVDAEKGIFLLADGMGGHQAGEVASSLAVQEAHFYIKDRLDRVQGDTEMIRLLREAIFYAHFRIKERARSDPDLAGMGTTLVIAVFGNDTVYIGHVGDSRAYLVYEGMRQITRDHTVKSYFTGHAFMARRHLYPQRTHILTQAVGTSEELAPEMHSLSFDPGDILLLCSDGLTDMLTDEEIAAIIRENSGKMEKAAEALVEEANDKGGRDNISVILVRKL